MTNATRWGVSALMMIGGLSLGAFAGCSDDDPKPVEPEVDSGVLDTAPKDTGTLPMDTAMPDTPDTAMYVPDRAATVIFGSPDLGSKFLCFGAFLDDPATKDAPLDTLPRTGAAGVPDPADPDPKNPDYTKTTAFPYGAVVPMTLNETAVAALNTFNFVVYIVDENPAKMMPAKTCKDMWATVKGDTWRWKSFPKGSIAAGDHGLMVIQGCRGAATTNGACGATGNNFEIKLRKAAMTKPTEAGSTIGVQFLHLSQFGGVSSLSIPGFQNVDIYLKPGPAAGGGDAGADADEAGDADAAAPAPALIKIAENVKYNDEISALKGITLPAGTKNADSWIVVAPRVAPAGDGGMTSVPCSTTGAPTGAPPTGCPNWTFPLAPFFAATTGYQRVGGGLEFPNTNQVIAISGSPMEPLSDGGMGTPTLRLPFARGGAWTP